MAFQYRKRGFFTWSLHFQLDVLRAVFSWSLQLCILLYCLHWLYTSFPELYAYTFCYLITRAYKTRIFVFYSERYHRERQIRIMLASLTPQQKINIKNFIERFIRIRDAEIPVKRQLFLWTKGTRQRILDGIVKDQERMEHLIQRRQELFASYHNTLAEIRVHHRRMEIHLARFHDRDDWIRFEADIDNPRNTVLRIIDQQLETIAYDYRALLIENLDEPLRTECRRLLASRLHKEAYIERILIRYYKKLYTDTWDMAIENKRWYESLKHLIGPPPVDWPEYEDDDESTPKDLLITYLILEFFRTFKR
jgi:hypothetical protein